MADKPSFNKQDYLLDKYQTRRAFDRSARDYDEAAVLQREVADRVLERLDLMKPVPHRILDVGAGTGYCTQALARRYTRARVVALDIAEGMLRAARVKQRWWQRLQGRQRYVCGDAESLPLADASVDMLFSNLALQWCSNLETVFDEFRRVLAPGGLLLFTTFGPDTLRELRESWRAVDGHTHVNAFMDMHDIGDALLRARFENPVMDMEHLTLTYPDVRALMRDLKQIGAHNVTLGRARGLTGARRMQAMLEAYEAYRQQGVLPATYEVIYGHAWMSSSRTAGALRSSHGEFATVSLESLRDRIKGGKR